MEAQDVRQMWRECHDQKVSVVARRHGLTRQALMGLFWEWRLLGNELDDPSPEDIERQTATFRSQWSETTEQSRWMGARTVSQ